MRFAVAKARRIVIKLGTHVVTHENGEFALGRVAQLVELFAALRREGREVLVVSSGAVGLGRALLGLQERPRSLGLRQACAAAGQGRLMAVYSQALALYQVPAAQVLLTQDDLADPDRALCLRTTLLRLLELGAVPILNENDSVSVRELVEYRTDFASSSAMGFGDNDGLSARIASAIDADLLVLLTDVDGFYTANPHVDPNAKRVETLTTIDDEALGKTAGQSSAGTGGMRSKLEAARFAQDAGIDVLIAAGTKPAALAGALAGSPDVGTWIPAPDRKSARQRKIALEGDVRGALVINDGAMRALLQNKASLLPVGVLAVNGRFARADIVEVKDSRGRLLGRGQTNYSSDECRLILGLQSDQIAQTLGFIGYDALINRQNMSIAPAVLTPDSQRPSSD